LRRREGTLLVNERVQFTPNVHLIDGFYNEIRPHQAKGCPPMYVCGWLNKRVTIAPSTPAPSRFAIDDRIIIGRRYRGPCDLMLMTDLDMRVVTDDGHSESRKELPAEKGRRECLGVRLSLKL
jgi:hypothetical protein